MTPSCPRFSASSRNRSALGQVPGPRSAAPGFSAERASRGSRAARVPGGRADPRRPREARRRRATRAALASTRRRRSCFRSGSSSAGSGAACRRPSSAIASPSRTIDRTGSASTSSTTSGTRSVTSARFRVNARTSSPTPVHLEPRAVELPLDGCGTQALDGALEILCGLGEHRLDGTKHRQAEPGDARVAAREQPRRPPRRDCRRASSRAGPGPPGSGRHWPRRPSSRPRALLASALPAAATCRKRCSLSVARSKRPASSAARSACEPFPEIVAMRPTAVSTSSSSSVGGGGAAGGRSCSDAHPTPTDPCGNSPARYETATGTSSGRSSRRHAAMSSVFCSRADVSATSADVRAISSSSTS